MEIEWEHDHACRSGCCQLCVNHMLGIALCHREHMREVHSVCLKCLEKLQERDWSFVHQSVCVYGVLCV